MVWRSKSQRGKGRCERPSGLALGRAPASEGDGSARGRAQRRSLISLSADVRVVLTSLAMVGLAGAAQLLIALLGAGRLDVGLSMPWLLLAVLFLGTEVFVVHVEFRGGDHTFSLSEIPLVLGLFFVDPLALLTARMVGSGIALLAHRRPGLLKVSFNLAMFSLQAGLVSIVFQAMPGPGVPGDPRSWVAAYVAMSAATLLSTLTAPLLVKMSRGRDRLRLASQIFGVGMLLSIFTNTSLALLAVEVLGHDLRAGWLLVAVAVVLCLAYRAYASLRQRHARLGLLYEFIGVAGRPLKVGAMVRAMLTQTLELLRAERAEITLVSGTAEAMRITLGSEGQLEITELPGLTDEGMRAEVMRSRRAVLAPRHTRDPLLRDQLRAEGMRDVVVAPLVSEANVVGTILVADRASDASSFDGNDLQLFEALANHASVAIENGRLVERLRREAADKEHQAFHDTLTGLPNRAMFRARVSDAIARAEQSSSNVAVMLIDLDRFKEVNDTLGHHNGDLLLKAISNRLKSALKASDTIARLGGDEFAVVLADAVDETAAAAVAERLNRALFEPFQLGELTLDVGASIGIAMYPLHGSEPATLLQRADVAMYSAKTDRTRFEIYSADSDHYSPTRLALVGELRVAIENGELTVHYQPKADVRTGVITGVEALLRWKHPQHGLVGPDEFVAIAEQTGAIRPLTLHVLRTALHQCARWRAHGWDLDLAVNLSVRSLLDADLTRDIEQVLAESGVPAAALTLEITEGSTMADSGRTVTVLRNLSDMGVNLAIDDFGTGYSSLSYLKRLPVNEVKIDRSFVINMATDENDAVIVRSTIDLGHNLGLRVVAEGVENHACWARLVALGCDVAQGYYLSPPVPAGELESYLLNRAMATGPDGRGRHLGNRPFSEPSTLAPPPPELVTTALAVH